MAHTQPHAAALHVLSNFERPRQALLKWYDGVHEVRGMPWRKPYQKSWNAEEKAQRAYEVWVSEIMLQQTQVATVIPYYNRWMERFPTIRDLAASDIDTVYSLWKGLGYYSRAARLLSGAQKAVKELGGRLPDNAQDMESKIPGIGRYSAGAICSIAYNQCVPVLDGNVHRLLSRLLALHAPPKAKQTLDALWAGASAFVEGAERPGDVNQALIELGSTVCKVRDPACSSCALRPWCAAYKRQEREGSEGQGAIEATSPSGHEVPDIEELCTLCEPLPVGAPVTAYPMKAEKKKAREELDIVNVIEWRNHPSGERWFLLVRRPEGGLLAGLHEFPTAANVPVTSSSSAHIQIADSLLSALLVSPPSARSFPATTLHGQTARRSTSQQHTSGDPSPGSPRVAKIVPAGDVLHVFSHIRKTYRVQWVVLEGGSSDAPPALVQKPDLAAFGAAMPKTSKGKPPGKKRVKASDEAHGTPGAPVTQWVRMEDVAEANIGTGVMKIWRQVRALWGDDGDGVRAD
ncbi:DNA glycosylase [Trametes coccinea BRFM310]|uniref:Adenine DNA glycosylase n=1 Tax=Trametes coccinea (strain BRFM310) TaxID=1353009 RepID=A0A1Y2J7F8_TRAC3|nr:DNA glycosylase [Trametes coccinea BRFM310]